MHTEWRRDSNPRPWMCKTTKSPCPPVGEKNLVFHQIYFHLSNFLNAIILVITTVVVFLTQVIVFCTFPSLPAVYITQDCSTLTAVSICSFLHFFPFSFASRRPHSDRVLVSRVIPIEVCSLHKLVVLFAVHSKLMCYRFLGTIKKRGFFCPSQSY